MSSKKKPAPEGADVLLKTRDICERLQVHDNTVNRWVQQGKLKPVAKLGRGWRFTEAELKRFLRESLETDGE